RPRQPPHAVLARPAFPPFPPLPRLPPGPPAFPPLPAPPAEPRRRPAAAARRAGHGRPAPRRAGTGGLPHRAPERGAAAGAGRGVRVLVDGRMAYRRAPHHRLGVPGEPRPPTAPAGLP